VSALLLAVGCSGSRPDTRNDAPVSASLNAGQQKALAAIDEQVAACRSLSTDEFLSAHRLPQVTSLPYDPASASGLAPVSVTGRITGIHLDVDERATLAKNGFVISDRKSFPSFVYGYASIYGQDLPVYVSIDSILHAVHKSFDGILKAIEMSSLVPELGALLGRMRGALAGGAASTLGAQARADVDFYLAVASGLLGLPQNPVAGAKATDVSDFVSSAVAASGAATVTLFGAPRDVDFSQFVPRGHYADDPTLQQYFRAMTWLGQIDLRILEARPDRSLVFHRRQLEGAYALGALMDGTAVLGWQRIHDVIAGFVGQPDSMTVQELPRLLADLGLAGPAGLATLSDEKIADAVIAGGYGEQSIAGHIMVNGLGAGTMPLGSSFLLFGQAYVIDAHVFSNLVYDRVGGGRVLRMMPNPLDVSFSVLGDDQAASLLSGELAQYPYAPDLCAMRAVVSAHGDSFWQGSLYNLWVSSLRTLAPGPEVADPASVGMPTVTGTEPWGRRLASTQLASWAELRHDTILYVKQSYTSGDQCEFPDAYVDPYPRFWGALASYAERGKAIVAGLQIPQGWRGAIDAHFDNLGAAAQKLQAMAEEERTGMPFTAEQMAWINQAVSVQPGCGVPYGVGWFPNLYFGGIDADIQFDPTIADVHTQPTDASGNPVGRVLHVATGRPRLMVVTVETCSGPRAFAGLASSYFEQITENYDRIDDNQWSSQLEMQGSPPDVPWMNGVVVR
jgi:hypothetical protein